MPDTTEVVDIENKQVILHTTIHYPETNNENEGETILLLHGGPGVAESFTEVANILKKKFRVVCFEQRGIGQSINPTHDYSMEAYISDIDAIATHLKLKKIHIWGHSWGGLLAQIYAEARPERIWTMFLSSPSSGTNELWIETEKEVLAYNQANSTNWEFLQMGWYSLFGMMGLDWAYQNLFHLVLTVYHRNHAPNTIVDVRDLHTIKAEPINATRPCIQAYKATPTIVETPGFEIMLTYGDADIYGSSREKSISRYPTAKTKIIENCGHIPWIHNPTSFAAILNEFYSL